MTETIETNTDTTTTITTTTAPSDVEKKNKKVQKKHIVLEDQSGDKDLLQRLDKFLKNNFDFNLSKGEDQSVTNENVQLVQKTYPVQSSITKNVHHLFTSHFIQKKPKAVLFVIHGAGSNSRVFAPFCNLMKNFDIEIIVYDHLNHGCTGSGKTVKDGAPKDLEDKRKRFEYPDGCIPSFKVLYEDAYSMMDHFLFNDKTHSERLKNLPVFVVGQSMGGATVIEIALNDLIPRVSKRIRGIIGVAPAVVIPGKPNVVVTSILKGLAYFAPKLTPIPADPQVLSTSSEAIDFMHNNSKENFLVVPMPLQLMTEVVKMTDDIVLNLPKKKLNKPFLLFHGDVDKMCGISGAKQVHELNQNQDSTFYEFPNARHALNVEFELFRMVKLTNEWINERL